LRVRRELEKDDAGGRSVSVREDAELRDGTCVLEGDGGEVRLDDDEMLERLGRAMGAGGEADR
jgi:flagellar biosynthesis/type III secretory pathway protein FliH